MNDTVEEIKPVGKAAIVSGDILKTALKFVEPGISREKARYYLNGIYFDKQPNAPLYLVTTDGHRLHKIALECNIDDAIEFNFLMKVETVKTLIKMLDKRIDYTLTFDDRVTVGYMNDGVAYGNLTDYPIDGKFPDYQRVIPKTEKRAEMDSFNARYLADVGKAFGLLKKSVAISAFQEEKGNPTIFKVTGWSDIDALIVLMPMRD